MGAGIALAVIALADLMLGVLFCRDGQFRQWRLPPYPLLFTENQREWLHRDDWPYYRFDAELGWTLKPDAVFGEGRYRTNAEGIRSDRDYALEKPPEVTRVAVFGDSYVHGDEVSNPETAWAAMEASSVTLEVLNFGVPGYGTDQAYLRYVKEAAKFRPDVVLVGLMPENIQRNVSVFRPVYYPQTGLPLAKPRFRTADDGTLALVPCPASSVAELRELVDTGRLTGVLEKTDYWVARAPLSYRGSRWFSSSLIRILYAAHANGGREYRDYYGDPESEPFRVTIGVLKMFCRRAKEDGARRAAVVILPDKTSLREEVTRSSPSSYWRSLVDRLEGAGVECLDLFPAMIEASRHDGVDALFVGTHYNARGQVVVADAVAAWLAASDGRRNQGDHVKVD